ncbi:Corticotropin-releasing factor receptor 1 [Galemys pyrenaicus]|uniref:Corticotropin-releasing factor receptor 1 n=1 Tax=Galemys pyrenaicus TaxID=202257 RepID=A0A8J5ZNR2_GALPY|nr:Corticotropin-releasing factor receptor 1 [Galemys pyrenaicus]
MFPQALLLLGLNPVSASLQNQHCESLSLASNFSGLQCNASVDLIGTCWPRSPAGQLVVRPCPAYFYGVRYNTTNNGYRQCLANGSWAARVNYSECQEILNEEKKSKVHYHVAVIINYLGHCISLAALLVAFVLFLRLRSIRCLRNIIHWNLISAFILRNATWFVVQLTMSPEVHQSNVVRPARQPGGREGLRGEDAGVIPSPARRPQAQGGAPVPVPAAATAQLTGMSAGAGRQGWCRLVTAAYNYFHVTNFFWMFGEGCYLHTAIVLTYSTDRLRKWMFICIGWGVPFPIIVAWAIGKLYYDNEKCWFGKRPGVYTDYIYQGPMILVLLINFIFLFNIVRILMTKLRASTTSETIQYRKAVKATLVLLPLLGITYMLFFVNPGEDEVSRVVFIYFNSFLESFQGFFVSVFYCFLNSECSPVQHSPVQCSPVQCSPVQRSPVQCSPVQRSPVQHPPVQCSPVQRSPVQRSPVQCSPVQHPPVQLLVAALGEGGDADTFALCPQVRSAIRKRWRRWQDKHSIRARVARAMSIPTSPTRVSFHSIKQSTAV